ncbi:MAG TPA: hypothetical protein VHP55_08060 [Usitatibacter sp.]|jgi:hypothetical protein|nr:hypothetical protein [Usitatibacter sp.]
MPAAAEIRTLTLAALAGFSTFFPEDAFSARPMITDDARVVDPKSCQVESWIKFNRTSTEYWALPACNPLGLFELTYGGARIHEDSAGSAFTDNIFQLKTIVKPLEANGWGWGIAAGTDRHLHREAANGWPGDEYIYVPVSFSFRDDEIAVHLNGGVTRHRDIDRNIGTWGLGSEIRLRDDLFFIPETFGTDRGRPFFQLGLRHWIVKDRLQMDATVGNRLGGDSRERWFSLGLRALSPPFLP